MLDTVTDRWLSFAKQAGINKLVISFIEDNPCLLDPPINTEDGRTYPSQIGWLKVADLIAANPSYLSSFGYDASNSGYSPIKDLVGLECGTLFVKFAKYMADQQVTT